MNKPKKEEYQLDIFGNWKKVSLIRLEEKCDKLWKTKVNKGFLMKGFDKNVSKKK